MAANDIPGTPALFKYLFCLLEQIRDAIRGDGFGDPNKSDGGDVTTGAGWTQVCQSTDVPSVLFITNTGGVEVEWAVGKDSSSVKGAAGGRVAVTQWRSIDRFKGKLFARSVLGAGTLNWYMLKFNQSD